MKVSQMLKTTLCGVGAVAAMMAGVMLAHNVVLAAEEESSSEECTGEGTQLAECYANLANGGNTNQLMPTLRQIITVVLGVIGFVAVAVIVYGGIQYTLSSGDVGKIAKAKNTIVYGIVGLLVALLASAIVNFVLIGVFHSA